MMTKTQQEMLMDDFRKWSGGFKPESLEQITIYMNCARIPIDGISVQEIREDLEEWMDEIESD